MENQIPNVPEEELKLPDEPITPPSTTRHSSFGVLIGVLGVVLILLLGGLYLWGASLHNSIEPLPPPPPRPTAEENNEPESENAEADTQALQTVSNSDELSAIEADLESTNLESLDAEMTAIEAELTTTP